MKLSARTRAAIRVLLQVGLAKELMATRRIATNLGIPQKFITTVIVPLKRAGFLTVKRGIKGGLALAKPPDKISVVEVIELFQGPFVILECLSDRQHCSQKGSCPFLAQCAKINDVLLKGLRDYTLAKWIAGDRHS